LICSQSPAACVGPRPISAMALKTPQAGAFTPIFAVPQASAVIETGFQSEGCSRMLSAACLSIAWTRRSVCGSLFCLSTFARRFIDVEKFTGSKWAPCSLYTFIIPEDDPSESKMRELISRGEAGALNSRCAAARSLPKRSFNCLYGGGPGSLLARRAKPRTIYYARTTTGEKKYYWCQWGLFVSQ
jgi:hypothetical protein